jgi:Domain of Unknown Function (DUF1080)
MKAFAVFALGALALTAADNKLTPEEKQAGYKLLFDGKTMKNWQDPALKKQPGDCWVVENGCLKTKLKPRIGEDLITQESFRDFDLLFDWRISQRGNTGLKYRLQREVFVDESKVQKGPGAFEGEIGREIANPKSDRATMAPGSKGYVYTVSFEFQLLDDERHPDAKKDASHVTGALYSMIPPSARAAKPAGEWNSARLVVKGSHFEHWINGVKVLDGSLDDPRIEAGAAKRWKQYAPQVYEALAHPKPEGRLMLQHHGDEVWFKNIKVKRLN